ncbi:MAG: alpha/beta fold hydrolase [Nevskiales bacterium]|nr:alpha/beta fold hydrolase [Nevskiales bacterium]
MKTADFSDTTADHLVCFAHGKESGPWGHKITHLAKIARKRDFAVISPDYRHTQDPAARVAHLLALRPRARKLVLVGSSMGGYVSAMACTALRPTALFLMAPALYFPGWDTEPEAVPALCSVVHGWRDSVVPHERGLRFAQRHRAALHLLDAEHGLTECLDMIGLLFDELLTRTLAVAPALDDGP